MNYFMGIDLGTSSAKVLVTDEYGNTAALAQREYPIQRPGPGYAQQDMEVLYQAVKDAVREITRDHPDLPGRILAISYSGQMHGLVMLDSRNRPAGDAIIWCDQRSAGQIDAIYSAVTKEAYNRITLNNASAGFLLTSLLWVRENEPERYDRIRTVMLPKDYIRYRMCGETGTDLSDASATGAFDTGKGMWADSILEKLDIPSSFFPPCHVSHEPAGRITAVCGEETGLKRGTMVVYGGGDSIMQQIGNGLSGKSRDWIANIGTSCSLNCIQNIPEMEYSEAERPVKEAPVHDRLYRTNTFCHASRGAWMLMGADLCGGAALKWLKNEVLMMDSYDEMTGLASQVPPGSDGLYFLPYLNGSRCPVNDPRSRGVYMGLTLNHNRAHFIRSTMEGIVYGLKSSFLLFESLGLSADRIIASGGGARGELFLQLEADILNRPVAVTKSEEQACLGAAITAAVGCGFYDSYEEAIRHMVSFREKIYVPQPGLQMAYEEYYAIYSEIYGSNQVLFHKISGS